MSPDTTDTGMSFMSSIGFSITAKCPIACRHCIIEAGPDRKEEMSPANAIDWIRQAAGYREHHLRSIIFTGGEPFYNRPLLAISLSEALACGLVPAVMTNAFWANSLPAAVSVLKGMPPISMLTISTDKYHQRFIPFGHIRNAVLAARELGILHSVAVCFEDEKEDSYQKIWHELQKIVGAERIRPAGTLPAGRARKGVSPISVVTTNTPPDGACTGADFPLVFPDGRVIACMGMVRELPTNHPLLLGNLNEQPLATILNRAEMNTALHMLRLWGPKTLVELLRSAGAPDRVPKQYLKHGCCDLCYALASDRELLSTLLHLTARDDLRERTAYARLYYFNEQTMLQSTTAHQTCENEL